MFKKQNAFTLIELMVTMAVAAVVIGVAVPSFNKQMLDSKSVTLGESLVTEINLARYEAVRHATRVSLCASSNGTSCAGNWTDGLIVFVDTAASDTDGAAITGQILYVLSKPDIRSVITVKNNGANVSFIRFTALGSLARIANAATNIDIAAKLTGCSSTGKKARSITIGLSGIVSVQKTEC